MLQTNGAKAAKSLVNSHKEQVRTRVTEAVLALQIRYLIICERHNVKNQSARDIRRQLRCYVETSEKYVTL